MLYFFNFIFSMHVPRGTVSLETALHVRSETASENVRHQRKRIGRMKSAVNFSIDPKDDFIFLANELNGMNGS